jgi:hypothetical protein
LRFRHVGGGQDGPERHLATKIVVYKTLHDKNNESAFKTLHEQTDSTH